MPLLLESVRFFDLPGTTPSGSAEPHPDLVSRMLKAWILEMRPKAAIVERIDFIVTMLLEKVGDNSR